MNQLYQQLNQSSNQPNPAKQIADAYKSSQNPKQLFVDMLKRNPNANTIMSMLKSGGNPKDLFYSLAQQRGIDPNSILSMFK